MCGRYYIEIDNDELNSIIREAQANYNAHEQMKITMKMGEIYPTEIVPVISMERRPLPMKWGFTRFDNKGVIINARSETIAEKPMFRRALHEGRCLIPASNYFEWEKLPNGKKQKYALGTREKLIYMAGLYRTQIETGLSTFVILTRSAAPQIAHLHDRMPVILPIDARREWLAGDWDTLHAEWPEIRYAKA